jgi:hypothetical protein
MRKVTVSRMRERYAQTILTFRITYVEMFQTKVAEKNQTASFVFNTFVRKSCRLWDNAGNFGASGQARCKCRRMRVAWWLSMATNKYSQYAILIAFLPQQWLPPTPRTVQCPYCYVFLEEYLQAVMTNVWPITTESCQAHLLTQHVWASSSTDA